MAKQLKNPLKVAAGKQAAQTIKKRLGDDFYEVNGRLGGLAKVTKGFGSSRKHAREAGRKGGLATKAKMGWK